MLTASDITDAMVDEIVDSEDDDIELLDLCETTQKQIVQPEIKRAALARIAEILNERADDNYDGPKDGEAWSGGFAENH